MEPRRYCVATSRHPKREPLARAFGATDIITERGEAGVEKIKELTDRLRAHSVIEAVGTHLFCIAMNILSLEERFLCFTMF